MIVVTKGELKEFNNAKKNGETRELETWVKEKRQPKKIAAKKEA